jgi:hypothetical protein
MSFKVNTNAPASSRGSVRRPLLSWLLVVALAGAAAAQSTDPKTPTPLTAGEITGGEIEERASYYFSFDAGPGEVTAALEAKMKKNFKRGGVGVELLDAGAKSLAAALVSGGLDAGRERVENELLKQLGKLTSAADSVGGGDTKQKTARVKVGRRQPLVLKLTVDKGVESFTLRVGGAVEFAQYAPPPADAGQTWATDAATPPQPADPSAPTDPAQTTPQSDSTAQPPAAQEAKPTSGKPAVRVPVRRPALVKVPAKQPQAGAAQQPQSPRPALVRVPGKPSQPQQQPASKPQAIRIPSKKQP